jgi:hypothetical protein
MTPMSVSTLRFDQFPLKIAILQSISVHRNVARLASSSSAQKSCARSALGASPPGSAAYLALRQLISVAFPQPPTLPGKRHTMVELVMASQIDTVNQ